MRQALRSIAWVRQLNVARVQFQLRMRHQREYPPRVEVEDVPCPLCGNATDFDVRYRPYLRSPIRIVACRQCTLSFLRPMPTEKFYDWFYSNDYMGKLVRNRAQAEQAGNATYKAFSTRALRIGKLLAPILLKKSQPVVLEVGAAHGFNLAAVGAEVPGARLYENELDRRWAAMYAEQHIDNWQARPPGTLADALVLSHVVEHFREPVAALAGQRQHLAPDSVVYIEVPNVPTGTQASLPFKLAHTMYFSPRTLAAVANRAGLENIALNESEVISSLWRLKA